MTSSMEGQRLKVSTLNSHITCVLCGGYLIDAATITECLHSFCRACIVRYLEASTYCPVCDTRVHESNPLLSLRPDYILQDLVFKLVPGLITSEVRRRKEFFYQHCPVEGDTSADILEASIHRHLTHGELFYTEDEKISVCLEHSQRGLPDVAESTTDSNNNATQKTPETRYLLCPAPFTIKLLKKFLRNKYELPDSFKVDIFHTKDSLSDSYTLMDVAYIYTWRKSAPLRLFYSIYEARPSLPVHIQLPPGLVRRRLAAKTKGTAPVTQRPLVAACDTTEDSKRGMADKIQAYIKKRARNNRIKLRAKRQVRTGKRSNRTRGEISRQTTLMTCGVSIKEEILSDDCTGSNSSTKLPSPTRGAVRSVQMTIPRYMVRGRAYNVRKRKYDSSSREASSDSYHGDAAESVVASTSSSSDLQLYEFDDDEDDEFIKPPAAKIFRRRYSDSSWSSEL